MRNMLPAGGITVGKFLPYLTCSLLLWSRYDGSRLNSTPATFGCKRPKKQGKADSALLSADALMQMPRAKCRFEWLNPISQSTNLN